MKLDLRANTYWRESYRLIDHNGVTHMSLIGHNDDLDDDTFFVPCLNTWMLGAGYRRAEGALVTCVACTMFVVREGWISLWVPSSES